MPYNRIVVAAPVQDPQLPPSGPERAALVQEVFGRVAPSYDKVNHWMSLGQHQKWRTKAAAELQLKPGDRVLDVCCGTGDFLAALEPHVGPSGQVVGIDFAPAMLEGAAAKGHPRLSLGDATRLPIQTASFDAVTIGWGLRNVADLDGTLRELARILKPGGRLACLDMTPSRHPLRQISDRVFHWLTPRLGRRVGMEQDYQYLVKSTDAFLDAASLSARLRAAGFDQIRVRTFMFGHIALHIAQKS